MAQLAGWFVVVLLYFRERIEWGFDDGLILLTIALTAISWVMAVGCSSALAAAYLRMPPRWLSGLQAIPIVLGLSLVAALPWSTVATLLVAGTTPLDEYLPWVLFNTSVLMMAWSGAFLWFMRSDGVLKTPTRVPLPAAFAPEARPSEPKPADRADAETQNDAPSPSVEAQAVAWRPDDQVSLHEGTRVKFCRVRDIAYVQAADDYTEVHLSSGEVAVVTQRLRHWESHLPESFVRIHRSTLVNLELTEELVRVTGSWKVRLRGYPHLLTMSRRAARVVRARLEGRPPTG